MAKKRYFDDGSRPRESEIRAYVREECDGMVLVGDWESVSPKESLHIPSESGDYGRCEYWMERGKWREKSLDVYPPGSKEWCTICLAAVWPDRANVEVHP